MSDINNKPKRIKIEERIKRLLEFCMEYPELWDKARKTRALPDVCKEIVEASKVEDKEAALKRLLVVEEDYEYIYHRYRDGKISDENLARLKSKEAGVGRAFGFRSEYVEILKRFEGTPNFNYLKKHLTQLEKSGVPFESFREDYIQSLIDGKKYLDKSERRFFVTMFDLSEPDLVLKNSTFYDNFFSAMFDTDEPVTLFVTPELKQAVDEALDSLPERTARILRLRFGYDGELKTLEEVGKDVGYGRERVRMYENKGLRTIRHYSRSEEVMDIVKTCDIPLVDREAFIREYFKHRDIFAFNEARPLEEDVRKRLIGIFEHSQSTLEIDEEKRLLDMPVEKADLSERAIMALRGAGITTVGDLIQKKSTDIGQMKRLGKKLSNEVIEAIHDYGLVFADELPEKQQTETRKKVVLSKPIKINVKVKKGVPEDSDLQFLISSIVDTYSSIMDEKKKNEEAIKEFQAELERVMKENPDATEELEEIRLKLDRKVKRNQTIDRVLSTLEGEDSFDFEI